nr:hypothetical protein [Mesorhizobium sp.]
MANDPHLRLTVQRGDSLHQWKKSFSRETRADKQDDRPVIVDIELRADGGPMLLAQLQVEAVQVNPVGNMVHTFRRIVVVTDNVLSHHFRNGNHSFKPWAGIGCAFKTQRLAMKGTQRRRCPAKPRLETTPLGKIGGMNAFPGPEDIAARKTIVALHQGPWHFGDLAACGSGKGRRPQGAGKAAAGTMDEFYAFVSRPVAGQHSHRPLTRGERRHDVFQHDLASAKGRIALAYEQDRRLRFRLNPLIML